MNVAIIKYNAGNTRSVYFALERLGIDSLITDDPEAIRKADKVILPGVGEAGSAMGYLKEKGLDKLIKDLDQPVLGICLGMQLLCRYSEEGNTHCLNIFDQDVQKFNESKKVPQIGWNTLNQMKGSLFNGIPENAFMYFVHSYYVGPGADTISETDYIIPFSSAIEKNNFFAVQFHPEKSGKYGEQILKNFLRL